MAAPTSSAVRRGAKCATPTFRPANLRTACLTGLRSIWKGARPNRRMYSRSKPLPTDVTIVLYVALVATVLFVGGIWVLAQGAIAWSKSISANHNARAHGVTADDMERTSDFVEKAEEELERKRPVHRPPPSDDDIRASILAEREANMGFSQNGHTDYREYSTVSNERAPEGWDDLPEGMR